MNQQEIDSQKKSYLRIIEGITDNLELEGIIYDACKIERPYWLRHLFALRDFAKVAVESTIDFNEPHPFGATFCMREFCQAAKKKGITMEWRNMATTHHCVHHEDHIYEAQLWYN